MFTDAQLLYLDEVLGTEARHYRRAVATPTPPTGADVIVATPALAPAERDLLLKILASVGLADYQHVEASAPGPCRHLLCFGGAALGRDQRDGTVRWGFHDLGAMTGASAEVTRRKREVWTLLQEFRREV